MQMQSMIDYIKTSLRDLAKVNDFDWFYDLHQIEIAECAEELLGYYPKADKDVVMLSCWLHDIVHYTAKTPEEIMQVKESHHIDGAIMAEKILTEHKIDKKVINKVKRCIECHRNRLGYEPNSIEEKIVAAADTYSHFRSIFYLTYFKCHPDHTIDEFVEKDLAKLERDWRDLQILPEAANLAKNKYEILKEMMENYKKRKVA